ncbi:MAG: phosphopentomutase [Solirubrobacteraceae bacterium]|nr:phosphopentomutase [Solirubrobacteraceae bacterium]
MSRRAVVVVLDACGVGALPDAARYAGDEGSNTLAHVAQDAGGLDLPVLGRLGLGSIVALQGVPPSDDPVVHGRLHPLGPGKESTTGHWELMGVVPAAPLPTYPGGFPPEVVRALQDATGLRFCANTPASGTEVIERWGPHHLRTGEVILYTSADSVLQLAAHHDVLSEPELLAACAAAREVMTGEHAVGRVIARPFEGEPGSFHRTEGRKDFSLVPPSRSYLDELHDAGVPVHAVGKVRDLFAGVGIDAYHPGPTNARAIASVTELLRDLDEGLVFANLVETDQVYGHRHDVEGFHRALREIDVAVGDWLALLRDGDLLVLTADHGVDPRAPHTDHTREHSPLLATWPGQDGRRHDGPLADVGASVLAWLTGREAPELPGLSFVGHA